MNAKSIEERSAAGGATGGAKALVKGIAVVNLLAEHRHGLRVTDLARELDLPRATTIRLLEALCAARLVRADADGRYRLGPRCAVWGSNFVSSFELRDAAADLMTELVDASNETCHLGICEARSVLYIHKVECAHSLRMVSHVGGTNPLHSTGLGKAILAFLPEEEQEEYLAGPLERRTPNTIVDAQMLRAELDRIRVHGYAVDDVENELGVRCIGAPIFDHDGRLAGSLSLSGPTIRMSWERMEQLRGLVVDAAGTISARLGHGLGSRPSQVDGNGKARQRPAGPLPRLRRPRSVERR